MLQCGGPSKHERLPALCRRWPDAIRVSTEILSCSLKKKNLSVSFDLRCLLHLHLLLPLQQKRYPQPRWPKTTWDFGFRDAFWPHDGMPEPPFHLLILLSRLAAGLRVRETQKWAWTCRHCGPLRRSASPSNRRSCKWREEPRSRACTARSWSIATWSSSPLRSCVPSATTSAYVEALTVDIQLQAEKAVPCLMSYMSHCLS